MKRYRGKLIALLCGLVLWILIVVYQSPDPTAGAQEWCRVLSNGALVPGVLFLGLGLLAWIAGSGQFDAIRYTFSNLLTHLRGAEKQYATYYDYLHREKKKGDSSPLILPGLLFLTIAVVLTLLYYVL